MKVNVKDETRCLFDDIEAGEVFYDEEHPHDFFLRTDHDEWAAVDLETGTLCYLDYFDRDSAQYHIVKAEVNIS